MAEVDPITASQVKAIHVALAQQGIDDDTYRSMLRDGWGVHSCKQLDRHQAHRLIMRLHGGRTKPRTRRPITHPAKPPTLPVDAEKVIHLPTPKQVQLIHDLIHEIAWDHTDGYRRWLRTCLGIRKVRTKEDAHRVILGLRGLGRGGHAKVRHE